MIIVFAVGCSILLLRLPSFRSCREFPDNFINRRDSLGDFFNGLFLHVEHAGTSEVRRDFAEGFCLLHGLSCLVVDHSDLEDAGPAEESCALAVFTGYGSAPLIVLDGSGPVEYLHFVGGDVELPEEVLLGLIGLFAFVTQFSGKPLTEYSDEALYCRVFVRDEFEPFSEGLYYVGGFESNIDDFAVPGGGASKLCGFWVFTVGYSDDIRCGSEDGLQLFGIYGDAGVGQGVDVLCDIAQFGCRVSFEGVYAVHERVMVSEHGVKC